MNFLVISLVMLGVAGAHGLHIPQQEDIQLPESKIKESLTNVFHHSLMFGAELFSNFVSEKKERFNLSYRLDHIGDSLTKLYFTTVNEFFTIYKEVDEEMTQKYPVYKKKVLPLVGEFQSNVSKIFSDLRHEIKSYQDQAQEEARKLTFTFVNQVKSNLIKYKDNWKSVMNINSLIARLKYFKGDVHKELEWTKEQETVKPEEEDLVEIIIRYSEVLMKFFDEEVELEKVLDELHKASKNVHQ